MADDPLQQYADAIAAVESDGSGGYSAVGPVTRNGDKALGRYQVMASNVPEWTQAALGKTLTPAEFLKDPDAQDAVFKHRFGNYIAAAGNPQDAASMWFTGRPLAQGGNASDGYITGNEYVRRFNNALGAQSDAANAPVALSSNAQRFLNRSQGSPQMSSTDDNSVDGQRSLWQRALAGAGGMGPALQDAGAYLMAPSNPGALAGTHHTAEFMERQKPQVVDGGTDLMGRKLLFTFSPATGQLTPLRVGASGSNSSGAGTGELTGDQLFSLIRQHAAGQLSTPDLMNRTGLIGEYAKSLADGTGDPRMLGNRAGPLRPSAIMLAKELNPSMPFDENSIAARQAYNRLLATGKADVSTLPGATVGSSKLVEHALQLAQNSKDLHDVQQFPNWTSANQAQNWAKAQGADVKYKSALNALNDIAETYSGEQDRMATTNHPTMSGHEVQRAFFSSDKSHAERMRALGVSLDAALAPLEQMNTNHNQLFGENKSVMDRLSPETQANLAKVRKMIGDAMTQSAPNSEQSAPAAAPAAPAMPKAGEVRRGYRFKGGNPADKNNWEQQ